MIAPLILLVRLARCLTSSSTKKLCTSSLNSLFLKLGGKNLTASFSSCALIPYTPKLLAPLSAKTSNSPTVSLSAPRFLGPIAESNDPTSLPVLNPCSISLPFSGSNSLPYVLVRCGLTSSSFNSFFVRPNCGSTRTPFLVSKR